MEMFLEKVSLCRKKMMLVMLLNFSDWLCTVTILKHDGFFEVNPFMLYLMDKPLLCFLFKCMLPLLLVSYIYVVLPRSNDFVVRLVNIVMIIISVFYLLINAVHIFNFVILLNL